MVSFIEGAKIGKYDLRGEGDGHKLKDN